MNQVQAVHERLMSQLPVRTVRTRREFDDAPCEALSPRRCGRPRAEELVALNRQINRLRAADHTLEEIQAITGASPSTIWRHLKGHLSTISQQRQDAAKRR